MSAATRARQGSSRRVSTIDLPIKANAKIYGGTQVVTDSSGWAAMATTAASLLFWGKAMETKDNTGGGNGALTINVALPYEIEVTLWENDDGTPVTNAMRGTAVYMKDNQTLTGDSSGASAGPFVYEVTTEGVWTYRRM